MMRIIGGGRAACLIDIPPGLTTVILYEVRSGETWWSTGPFGGGIDHAIDHLVAIAETPGADLDAILSLLSEVVGPIEAMRLAAKLR